MNKLVDNVDIIAEVKMDIFAIFIMAKSLINAISQIKIDIVNPIPAINETKNKEDHVILDGFSVIFNKWQTKENNIIPRGLPTHNPSIIPNDNEVALEKSKL